MDSMNADRQASDGSNEQDSNVGRGRALVGAKRRRQEESVGEKRRKRRRVAVTRGKRGKQG